MESRRHPEDGGFLFSGGASCEDLGFRLRTDRACHTA